MGNKDNHWPGLLHLGQRLAFIQHIAQKPCFFPISISKTTPEETSEGGSSLLFHIEGIKIKYCLLEKKQYGGGVCYYP